MSSLIPVTVAHGDGIGPEIMSAALRVLEAAKAPLAIETIDIGERVYRRGVSSGIEPSAWDSLRRTKVFFKAPITTPQGGGYKSLNVTVRNTLGLYANIRPCVSYHPYVTTKHPVMDVVIVRENEEDLYAGIEHRQTNEVMQCLKLISLPGCEKIIRYAFEYAVRNNRRRVTCFTKDNIMKLTDGLFHRVFEKIAAEYPNVGHDHYIVDIGAARLADTPEIFDVIVMPNLYGDVLSDVAAQIAGSVGLAGSTNIGAMRHVRSHSRFAPTIAGQNVANPSGLLLAGVMMLVHVGHGSVAERIHNAWLRTIEDGVHTLDIYNASTSSEKVGTREFADAVIARLGQEPNRLKPARYKRDATPMQLGAERAERESKKELVGVDVFVDWTGRNPEQLAGMVQGGLADGLKLDLITNRGSKVWPHGMPETFCTDHWRCRFVSATSSPTITHRQVIDLLAAFDSRGIDFIQTENLCTFDGQAGYSLGHGQ